MHASKLNLNEIRGLYWDKEYNVGEIADRLGVSFWSLYNLMDKHNINRRSHSEASYLLNRLKPQFQVKSSLSNAEEELKIAGVMLYWAEGTLKGNTVDFTNSNAYMIQVFLKFLRQICGIDERRLRLYLYAYSYSDLKTIKEYWHKITGISLNQFTKPYIKEGSLSKNNRKLPYGLVHIRYNDKKLLKIIDSWISDYTNSVLIWAGTQVAKGGRLYKSSVLSKGRMEK